MATINIASNRYLIRVRGSRFNWYAESNMKWSKSTQLNFNSFLSAKLFATKWAKRLTDPKSNLYIFVEIYLLPEGNKLYETSDPAVVPLARKYPKVRKWYNCLHGKLKAESETFAV